MNLFKYLLLLPKLMYLCVNKSTSKYGKIELIFYMHCVKLEECLSDHFPIHYLFFLFYLLLMQ